MIKAQTGENETTGGMKVNGFIQSGIAITAIGWLWLSLGSGIDTGYRSMGAVYNLNLGAMAQMTIQLGYTLLIVGTLVSGFRWLKPEPVSAVSAAERNASPLRDFAAAGKKAES